MRNGKASDEICPTIEMIKDGSPLLRKLVLNVLNESLTLLGNHLQGGSALP